MILQASEIVDCSGNIVDCTLHGKQYGYHLCHHMFFGMQPFIHEEPTSLQMGVCACLACAESTTPVNFIKHCQACVRYHVLDNQEYDHFDRARAEDCGYAAAEKFFGEDRTPIQKCPYSGELAAMWDMGWRLYVFLRNCGGASAAHA